MSDDTKAAIDKLKIIRELTSNNDLRQTINVVIELVETLGDKEELGFSKRTGA
ncbi:hypothetical protein [Rhodococcus pyridinivorans]|uniref:hypothetical protein n=1 Tax=Rhodococcus pyridinivorans TaxID=103816 RepID=UPI000ACC7683|nr:hypothetical protein [Rhodococcus pyridinivorans]